jgi:tRNA-splicing endonuclease subunit Sen2
MAEAKAIIPAPTGSIHAPNGNPPKQHRSGKLHQGGRQPYVPIPIKTFPLPSFYPSNPLSILHLVYSWLSQAVRPPQRQVYQGVWCPTTRSVNVTDPESLRALWEQGFFGKGNYSRSEPNWLKKEQIRLGLAEGSVAESRTDQRRQGRAEKKWERGRTELQAVETQLLEEAKAISAAASPAARLPVTAGIPSVVDSSLQGGNDLDGEEYPKVIDAPVCPRRLLALPNSYADIPVALEREPAAVAPKAEDSVINLADDASLSSSNASPVLLGANGKLSNGSVSPIINDANGVDGCNGDVRAAPLKRRKSVRFSPNVEATTFQHHDPPSPHHTATKLTKSRSSKSANGSVPSPSPSNGSILVGSKSDVAPVQRETDSTSVEVPTIENMEHLQLSSEEAFFLTFALGALRVTYSGSNKPISTPELLALFRRYSYFPPRLTESILSPDDPFLLDYVVYHHFRSLGWTVRDGTKFGTDWLLYLRGPVFSHAEFGILIIPSYSDPWWKENGQQKPSKSWQWLMAAQRVIEAVFKTLVLVYVDIPPPPTIEKAGGDISAMLRMYSVREIILKRWTINRNRD